MLAGRLHAMAFSLTDEARALSARWQAQPGWLLAGFGVCFLLGLIYHVAVLLRPAPLSLPATALYHVVVLTGFAALWQSIAHYLRKRTLAPTTVLWTTILTGVLVVAGGVLVRTVGPPELPEISQTSVTPLTVLRMHLMVLLEVGFAFFLLARLRQLVLIKRTRRSQRNWHLMIGLMAVAALSVLGRAPEEGLGVVQGLLIVPAVALMVINAFRLSWIVFLSFKEKMACMGLSVLLLILLIVGGSTGYLPAPEPYLTYYSHPLSLFATLAFSFGLIYAATVLLSLLFHLPTTSDFRRKADEMATLHALAHLVGQAFDVQKLAASIAEGAVEAGSAQSAWLMLADRRTGQLAPQVVAAHGLRAERAAGHVDTPALYREIERARAPLLLEEAAADHRVRAGAGIGSLLAVPLTARDRVLGVLVAAKEVAHGFEKDDVETLGTLGMQAALALDHARLLEEQIEKERLGRELAIARDVQRRLLPGCLPEAPGLSLCASSVPAQEIGGDYYDFVRLDDGRLAFIVADVSGKGTSAPFYMAEMQGVFQSGSRLAPDPARFLTHANEALAGALEKRAFISVIYGVLDLRREELVLARAGHCPAAAINLHGEARFVRPRGMGLGLDRGALFRKTLTEERLTLKPGDAFVLYTDGVVESRNAEGEEYGYDRLLSSLRAHRHEEAEALHAALLGDLHAFTGRDAYDDDMTLMVLKWHGVLEPSRAQADREHPVSQPATLDSG